MSDPTDVYLRFDDEAAAEAALAAEGLSPGETASWSVDRVGVIFSAPILDESGEVVTPGTQLPGWHVNIRFRTGAVPDSLAAARGYPETPARRFANGTVV